MADFHLRLIAGVDRCFRVIGAGVRRCLAISRNRVGIKKAGSKLEARFAALGKKVYLMVLDSTSGESVFEKDCREITALYVEISEGRELIRRVEEETFKKIHGDQAVMCLKCRGVVGSGAKFCAACGNNLAEQSPGKEVRCSNCRGLMRAGEKECGICGKKRG